MLRLPISALVVALGIISSAASLQHRTVDPTQDPLAAHILQMAPCNVAQYEQGAANYLYGAESVCIQMCSVDQTEAGFITAIDRLNNPICIPSFLGPPVIAPAPAPVQPAEPATVSGRRLRARTVEPAPRACPGQQSACPIKLGLTPFECVDTLTELSSCGRCGHDCSKIKGVDAVACDKGVCRVISCQPGFRFVSDANACVRGHKSRSIGTEHLVK